MPKSNKAYIISTFKDDGRAYERAALIDNLESLTIINCKDDGCAYDEMLKKEYEKALEAAGFDLSHIYLINGGRFKTKSPIQICRKRRIDVLRALYAYFYGSKDKITLKEVYDAAIIEYGKLVANGHREQNTFDHYTGAWKKYISTSDLPDMPIRKIKYKHLFQFYSDVTADQAMTRSTLRNIKTTIKYCFDYALQNDIIDSNVAIDVRTDKLVCSAEHHHDAYTAQELVALRKTLQGIDSPYARLIRLDLCLVARIGELEALKWEDVDYTNNSILIHAQIVLKTRDGKGAYEYVPHTKTGKYTQTDIGKRRLKLNSKAMEVLKEQRKINPFGEFIFLSQNGTPLRTNKINEHLKKYCREAGIRYLSSHSIRVSNITALFDNGVAPTKIQVAAGHSDIRTTNGYCRSEACDEIDLDILEKVL